MTEPNTLLSLAQAVDYLGGALTRQDLQWHCQKGHLGRKVGNTWVVTPQELDDLRARLATDARSKLCPAYSPPAGGWNLPTAKDKR